jgi:hypothetical protein
LSGIVPIVLVQLLLRSRMNKLRLTLLIGAVCTVSSCGQVYSPYLMLPSEPLKADEMQVVGTAGGLPVVNETWPGVNIGGTALVRYGITDRFSLQSEAWTRSWKEYSPAGFSIEGVELLTKDPAANWRFAVIPRVAVLSTSTNLEGWGVSGTLAAWTPMFLGGHPYLALGALAGAADAHSGDNIYRFGFGGSANAGIAYDLNDHLSVNAEISTQGILIRDGGTYYSNGFWVNGIGLGYKF